MGDLGRHSWITNHEGHVGPVDTRKHDPTSLPSRKEKLVKNEGED